MSPTGGMPPIPGHHRTPSGISNISLDSVSSTATLEAKSIDVEDVSKDNIWFKVKGKFCSVELNEKYVQRWCTNI